MTPPILPTVYKYLKVEHAVNMLRHGSIRIRPLVYYQNEEELGTAVGDKLEGSRQSSMVIKDYGSGENLSAHQRQFMHELGIKGDGVANVYVSQCVTAVVGYYAYCMSDILSNELLDEFHPNDGAAIVTIADLDGFYRAVTNELLAFAEPDEMGKVIYVNGEWDFEQHGWINPAYVKQMKYATQSEVRLLWISKGELLPYIDIHSPAIAAMCRETDISNIR